jgi:SH3-like domain-containing protein
MANAGVQMQTGCRIEPGMKELRYLIAGLIKRTAILVIAALMGLGGFPTGTPAAERMAVKADTANIRSGPGVTYDLLWQIEKYHPLLVVEQKGPWYRFTDFEGDEGWIHETLVDKTRAVIVKVRKCNVRSGPGTQYDVAFTASKGIPFKVLKTEGRWLQVQHADGDEGWIFNSLVW